MRGQKLELPIEEIPDYDNLIPVGNIRSRRVNSKEYDSPHFPQEEDSTSHNSSQQVTYKLPKTNYFQRNLAKRRVKKKEKKEVSESSSQKTPSKHSSSRKEHKSDDTQSYSTFSEFETPQSSNNSSPAAPTNNVSNQSSPVQAPLENNETNLPTQDMLIVDDENETEVKLNEIINGSQPSILTQKSTYDDSENEHYHNPAPESNPVIQSEKQEEQQNNTKNDDQEIQRQSPEKKSKPIDLMKPLPFASKPNQNIPQLNIPRPNPNITMPQPVPLISKPNSPSPSAPLNVVRQRMPAELNKFFPHPTNNDAPKQNSPTKRMIPTLPRKNDQNSVALDSLKRLDLANNSINISNPRFANRMVGKNGQISLANPYLRNESANDLLVPPADDNLASQYAPRQAPSSYSVRQKYIPQIQISQTTLDKFFAASAYSISENFAPRKANMEPLKVTSSTMSIYSDYSETTLRELAHQTGSLEISYSNNHDQIANITHNITEVVQKASIAKDKSEVLLDKMETISDTVSLTTITLQYALLVLAIIYWIIMLIAGIFMAPFNKHKKMSLNDAQNRVNQTLSHIQMGDSEADTETGEG